MIMKKVKIKMILNNNNNSNNTSIHKDNKYSNKNKILKQRVTKMKVTIIVMKRKKNIALIKVIYKVIMMMDLQINLSNSRIKDKVYEI